MRPILAKSVRTSRHLVARGSAKRDRTHKRQPGLGSARARRVDRVWLADQVRLPGAFALARGFWDPSPEQTPSHFSGPHSRGRASAVDDPAAAAAAIALCRGHITCLAELDRKAEPASALLRSCRQGAASAGFASSVVGPGALSSTQGGSGHYGEDLLIQYGTGRRSGRTPLRRAAAGWHRRGHEHRSSSCWLLCGRRPPPRPRFLLLRF